MVKTRKLKFKEQWFDAIHYLKETQKFIYAGIIIFVAFGLIGFFFAQHFTILNKLLSGIVANTSGLNWYQMVIYILQNNLHSSFSAVLFGFFLGIFPIINAALNGLVLGYVLDKVYIVSGFSEFWRILPHGIFELPAIFISIGMGIKFGAGLFYENRGEIIKERFYQSMNVFLMIVLPLLVIAAIIEGTLIIFFS